MFDEQARLAALHDYQILDTPPEPEFDDFTRLIANICEAPIAAINLVDQDRQWFKSEIGLGVRETPLDISICKHALLQKGLFVVPDTTRDPQFVNNPLVAGDPYLRFYAGALLETEDGLPLGTLCVLDYKPRTLTPEQEDALLILARQVIAKLELHRTTRSLREALERNEKLREELQGRQRELLSLNEDLTRLATTDPLTGLSNRRVFEGSIAQELSRFQRTGVAFSLILLDLDDFKLINDRFGHDTGDQVLRELADRLRPTVREVDLLARIGGEEFALLLPDTESEAAVEVAERLRLLVAGRGFAPLGSKPVTLSAGVTTVCADDTEASVFGRADEALYRAKDLGRNKVLAVQPTDIGE
ncbi:sensor domain-containing diguanylate cyclase [Thioalkalivibrio sp. ALJ7]|uniref:sensor domain-containing diguanylate cyclase n=1 Tax=Thioalkalivibrio sp. ALJ7 TaxID=1158756 RepID=UPI000366D042|nr:sensor domain-containing diguanylate cyclase [Thioalkalivibrio sp. ALJ7]